MSVPKDTWKIIGDAREHYMTIEKSFKDMDKDEQISWLQITEEIENQIKTVKSNLEKIMKPEEHKRNLVKPIQNQDKLKESNP